MDYSLDNDGLTRARTHARTHARTCLLYTSDAADDEVRVDLGGRRIIKKIFFQAEDGIRDREKSRGLGDVYKRQVSVSGGDAGNTAAWPPFVSDAPASFAARVDPPTRDTTAV